MWITIVTRLRIGSFLSLERTVKFKVGVGSLFYAEKFIIE